MHLWAVTFSKFFPGVVLSDPCHKREWIWKGGKGLIGIRGYGRERRMGEKGRGVKEGIRRYRRGGQDTRGRAQNSRIAQGAKYPGYGFGARSLLCVWTDEFFALVLVDAAATCALHDWFAVLCHELRGDFLPRPHSILERNSVFGIFRRSVDLFLTCQLRQQLRVSYGKSLVPSLYTSGLAVSPDVCRDIGVRALALVLPAPVACLSRVGQLNCRWLYVWQIKHIPLILLPFLLSMTTYPTSAAHTVLRMISAADFDAIISFAVAYSTTELLAFNLRNKLA